MSKGSSARCFDCRRDRVLVVIGTLWPVPSAVFYAGGENLLRSSSTPRGGGGKSGSADSSAGAGRKRTPVLPIRRSSPSRNSSTT